MTAKARTDDLIHAIGIARKLPDHNRIGRSQSFQDFSQKLEGTHDRK